MCLWKVDYVSYHGVLYHNWLHPVSAANGICRLAGRPKVRPGMRQLQTVYWALLQSCARAPAAHAAARHNVVALHLALVIGDHDHTCKRLLLGAGLLRGMCAPVITITPALAKIAGLRYKLPLATCQTQSVTAINPGQTPVTPTDVVGEDVHAVVAGHGGRDLELARQELQG